jgi:hypothetical protein
MKSPLFKVLSANGQPVHGGAAHWSLPRKEDGRWVPGAWMPPATNIVPCERGYHLVTADQLFHWFGPRIFVAEGRGDHVVYDEKHVYSEARLLRETEWTDRTARLFAADCAEHVLPLFEKYRPNDPLREALREGGVRTTVYVPASDKLFISAGRDVVRVRQIVARLLGRSVWTRRPSGDGFHYEITSDGISYVVAGLPPSCRVVWTTETETRQIPRLICGEHEVSPKEVAVDDEEDPR